MSHFRRHADALAQRRMRMDGFTDINSISAHFNRQGAVPRLLRLSCSKQGLSPPAIFSKIEALQRPTLPTPRMKAPHV